MKRSPLLFLLAAIACAAPESSVVDISPEQFLSNPHQAAVVLDVRSAEEFASGHVPGAVNVPHDELASRLGELDAGFDETVIVYCESGRRAGMASSILQEAGYAEVRHLAGDMKAWRENARPIAGR